MSENWSQGGSGGYGEDPYSRPEPRPDDSGRGRRRAGGPPPEGAARPDPRQPQHPQDPYGTGAFDSASYGAGRAPGQNGQNRYGLGAFDPADSYGPGASGGYGTDPYASGAQRPAPGRPPGGSGAYPTAPRPADPRAGDPYAGGAYPAAGAAPRRPQAQPGQPGQPPRAQPGRAPYGAAPQAARGGYGQDAYGRDGYDTGAPGYDSGSYETGQFDRRQPERPQYDRQQRSAAGYDRPGYEPDGYDPYRDDARSASAAGGRRRAADPVVDEDDYDYDRDEFDAEPPPRTRRRGGRRDEDEDFQLIDDDDHDDGDSGGRSGRRPKQPKRGRNCMAVLVAFAVVVGLLGGGGYYAYKHFSNHNSPPPDYTATTNADLIDVVIPTGAGGTKIGELLYAADVIKSEGAFINACTANPQCSQIQANTYLLPKEISAASAVELLLNPSTVDKKGQLNTYGGERAAQVFGVVEAKKNWTAGQIAAAMTSGQIDLPTWDTGKAGTKYPWAPIEGFICAEQYDLSGYSTPQALLKKMVDDQLALFTTENLAAKATSLNVTEYQLLTIASMAQAEAANTSDLPNIAGVVFNRLKDKAEFAHLGFDTVTLYGLGNTVTVPTSSDLKDSTNPYNTHLIVGLPPSPIGNPDTNALSAATTPAQNANVFFCAINSTTTLYATNDAGWLALGRQYPKQCGGG